MKISIIIPSIYPLEDGCDQVINSIRYSLPSIGLEDYEIVYVSPNAIPDKGQDILYVREDNPDGDVAAYNIGYSYSSGDIIIVGSDSNAITQNCLMTIPFLLSSHFEDRKFKVTSMGAPHDYVDIFATRIEANPPFYPNEQSLSQYYPVMGFPVFLRETIDQYLGGVIMNPKFKHHYHDNWLPFWLGENGEFPSILPNTSMGPVYTERASLSISKYDDKDKETYKKLIEDFVTGRNRSYACTS